MTKKHSAGEQRETEWTDQFGDHWEFMMRGPNGEILLETLTKLHHWGWSFEAREAARQRVRQAVAAIPKASGS